MGHGFYTPAPGYGQLLAASNPLHPTAFEGWFFTAYAGAMVVLLAVPWALRRLVKYRDTLPLLALISGAVTSLGEPMLDHVGHLRWATNLPGPAFHNFGLGIPALIPPCYMLFMGLESYWIYTMLSRGVNKRQFAWMAIAVGLSDAIMEHPGLAMHAYEYYGPQPFKDGLFPWYWAFTNSVAICTIGVLIFFVWPRVKGKGWLALAIIPLGIIGTTIGEFGVGFPVFLAINANIATWLQWVIGSLTLVLSALWIRVLAEMVCRETDVDWTFWGMFGARFMTPAQRARYIERKTRVALDIPPIPHAGNGTAPDHRAGSDREPVTGHSAS